MPESTNKDRELVLCVRSSDVADLFAVASSRPWHPATEQEVDAWLAKATVAFLPRSIAETDTSWRHLATYIVLTSGDRVFSYCRGKSGSENRLHGRRSIGVGGHIGIEDYDHDMGVGSQMLWDAGLRELNEELKCAYKGHLKLSGLIADSRSLVETVHLGVTGRMRIDREVVETREHCLADPQWVTIPELKAGIADYEVWSQIVIEHLLGGGA